jgi:hypothetical protein
VAFFIAGIIPVFDNVFPDKNAPHETGHFRFYQREPELTVHRPNGAGRHGQGELFS